ncbi:unnamed protein product [Somion occarium]|uniref:Uncharacterized protein n=1 Tax=Somion occarium TaxID=3059160 RepID=A0ABP1D3F4_9APHY
MACAVSQISAPGPSRYTHIPAVWRFAATTRSDTVLLSGEDHDEDTKERQRRTSSRRIRPSARAVRAPPSINRVCVEFVPHYRQRQRPTSSPLTSTLDTDLTNPFTKEFISCARDGEVALHSGDPHSNFATHEAGQGKTGSASHLLRKLQDATACAQPTCVRDEVPERPIALVFAVFEEEEQASPIQDAISHDMLALNPAKSTDSRRIQLGSVFASDSLDISPYDNCLSEEELLRSLRVNKLNLFLESDHPEQSPHIVISPPESPEDGYYGYIYNDVESQCGAYLCVPPRVEGHGEITILPPDDRRSAWKSVLVDSGTKAPCPWRTDDLAPPATELTAEPLDGPHVFSPSNYNEEIDLASTERLVMYHVVPALHRTIYKVAAIQASILAAEFRRNWDSPDFAWSVEKPFQWTDPAEPLLAYHHRQTRSLILDSAEPFLAPHIIIEEAEPQDPDEPYVSGTRNPQDYAFGQLLIVPARYVNLINVRRLGEDSYDEDEDEDEDDDEDDEIIGEDEGEYDEVIDEVESLEAIPDMYPDSSSDSDGPSSPSSPLDATWLDYSQFSDEVISKDGPADLFDEPEYAIDEDDDELPPFDDWYVSVAQRSI